MSDAVPLRIDDVWSRTTAKYRTRAILLLVANMILFGALCCFMFWLRTGWYFPPTYEHYGAMFHKTLSVVSATQVTLYDLFMRPINLQRVPMQAVVIGLLIASLVSIPILVSILYRLPASVPFCMMVSFLAVMPWLGATLLLSCVIATYARIKLKFRFAAALLGLVPIGVYFFTASQGFASTGNVLTSQMERGIVVAPLLLSGLASCALTAVVLTIARVVDYRPGAIAPLLAVMFLTPWFLFIVKVGRDELHYRFLEQNYGPRSREYFAAADAKSAIRRTASGLWAAHEEPRPTIEVFEERVRQYFASQLDPLTAVPVEAVLSRAALDRLSAFAREQHRVALECDKFLRDFPKSRYVPNVLYIKGRALDMRVDTEEFRRHGVLRFYQDFPSEASRSTWTALTSHEQSPLADVAHFWLAQLDARAGDIDLAIERLGNILRPRPDRSDEGDAGDSRAVLAKESPEASLEYEYVDYDNRARKLLSVLLNNREPLSGDAPLLAFLNCDPRHPGFQQNLREIVERFEPCKIRDNIALELSLFEADPAQLVVQLLELRARHAAGDITPRLLYELGSAYREQGDLVKARACFDELAIFADSPYAAEARVLMPVGSFPRREGTGG